MTAIANRRLMGKLFVVAALMFGFGFALVPLYEKLCSVTGLRSLLRPDHLAPANTQIDSARVVTIEFDSNTHRLPWTFKSVVSHVQVHPGELRQVSYEVRNNESRAVTGQAIPSYGPPLAAQHFKKIECFCFEQLTLAPGETRTLPIVFVVDPALPRQLNTITLSFTFFEVPSARESARVPTGGERSPT